MRTFAFCCLAAALTQLARPAARADMVAFLTGSSSVTTSGVMSTFGYTFTLATTTRVTQLGYYDSGGPGLAAAVPVTIWNGTGVALANATVPAGISPLVNGYAYVSLATPVNLTAGTYTIGAYVTSGQDAPQSEVATITGSSGITFGASRLDSGNADPTRDIANHTNAYFGPNFQFVPEPSTWAILGLGAVGAGVVALRRRACA